MELVLYFLVVSVVSIGSFWLVGLVYGLFHRPAMYFPLSLAAKMALCAVFGSVFFVVGGVVLATLVFNGAMMQRPDYRRWPTLIAGAVISLVCSVAIYFAIFFLAWEILD